MQAPSLTNKPKGLIGRDVLIACLIVILYGCWEIGTEGIISEVGGLGGDGIRHVTLAGRVPDAIKTKDTTGYEWRHILPYATVHWAFDALGIHYDWTEGRPPIILAHRIQNTICLVLICLLWGRILTRLNINPRIRRLSFVLLLLSFAFAKMPFYHPCNGDSTQFLFGVLMLYAYLYRRVWLLVIIAALSFFVRPGADIYALCLVAFMPPNPDEQRKSIPFADWFIAGCAAIGVFIVAIIYFQDPDRVRTIQPPLGFLSPISVPIAVLSVFLAFRFLLRDMDWQSLLRPRWLALPCTLLLLIAARKWLAGVAAPSGDVTSELYIPLSSVAYAVGRPASSLISHVIYFGPVALIAMVIWPRVCKHANAHGLGIAALFAVAILLGLHSESRLLTTPLPFFAAMVCAALNDMKLPRRFGTLCVVSGLLLSKVWLSMGALVPWSRLNYPDLLYWINQGPWIPPGMFIIQGLIVLIFAAIFVWAIHRDRLRDIRSWMSSPEKGDTYRPLLASGGSFGPRLAAVPRSAWITMIIGWGLVTAATIAIAPTLFATMPDSSSSVSIRVAPALVFTGSTTLSVLEQRYGAPSPPGMVKYLWKAGAGPEGGLVSFHAPNQRATRADFSKAGTYTILVEVRYRGAPNPILASALVYVKGLQSRVPLDLNWDGRTDIPWYNDTTGGLVFDIMNGPEGSRPFMLLVEPSRHWRPVILADLDGNEHTDVLWQNCENGTLVGHLTKGAKITQRCTVPRRWAPWQLIGFADFNDDGSSDMIWRDTQAGRVMIDTLWGGTITQTFDFTKSLDAEYELAGLGDFDGDGRADIIWRNPESGRVRVELNDCPRPAMRMLELDVPQWIILGCADFDCNGSTDVIWQHLGTMHVYVQYVQDRVGGPLAPDILPRAVDRDCDFVGIGDFNGDATPDLLWRNRENGGLSCHLMHRDSRVLAASSLIVRELSLDWKIISMADYNGDQTSDLLFRNKTSGEVFIYFMNGERVLASVELGVKRTAEFRVLGPRSDLRFVRYNTAIPPDELWPEVQKKMSLDVEPESKASTTAPAEE